MGGWSVLRALGVLNGVKIITHDECTYTPPYRPQEQELEALNSECMYIYMYPQILYLSVETRERYVVYIYI